MVSNESYADSFLWHEKDQLLSISLKEAATVNSGSYSQLFRINPSYISNEFSLRNWKTAFWQSKHDGQYLEFKLLKILQQKFHTLHAYIMHFILSAFTYSLTCILALFTVNNFQTMKLLVVGILESVQLCIDNFQRGMLDMI